jgi:CDP-diacylglycerol--glycerol-3-phosphate 3-phosphatidyltransferase
MSSRPAEPPLLNIANVLTGIRLLLVPVFVVALLAEDGESTAWRLGAFAVFAIASLTDSLDGDLARRHGLVTTFGTVADPIADKALTGSALIGLSILGEIPWWVTIVIMGRELGVTALRFVVIRYGVIPASYGGKAKTVLQMLAITLYLLPLDAIGGAADVVGVVRWVVLAGAVLLTVATGLDYVVRAWRLRASGARRAEPAEENEKPTAAS